MLNLIVLNGMHQFAIFARRCLLRLFAIGVAQIVSLDPVRREALRRIGVDRDK